MTIRYVDFFPLINNYRMFDFIFLQAELYQIFLNRDAS